MVKSWPRRHPPNTPKTSTIWRVEGARPVHGHRAKSPNWDADPWTGVPPTALPPPRVIQPPQHFCRGPIRSRIGAQRACTPSWRPASAGAPARPPPSPGDSGPAAACGTTFPHIPRENMGHCQGSLVEFSINFHGFSTDFPRNYRGITALGTGARRDDGARIASQIGRLSS
jgi:hypothetical protein